MTDNMLQVPGGIKLNRSSLEMTEVMPFEKWADVGKTLRMVSGCALWWLGDWCRLGEQAYGEKYAQALEATDYEEGTLRNAVYVASAVDPDRRRDELSFSHHQEVAKMEPDMQDKWLEAAVKFKWNVKRMRDEIHNKTDGNGELKECVCGKCGNKHKAR